MSTQNSSLEDALNLATDLYARGDFLNSLSLCSQILAQIPAHAPSWNLAGLNAISLALYDKAISYFSEAYTHAQEPSFLSNLAEAHRKAGNLSESRDILERLCAHDSRNGTFAFNLARTLQDLGEIELAQESYTRALELDPKDCDALFNLANLLAAQKPRDSLPLYQRAHELGDLRATHNLAHTLAQLGEIEESLALYELLLAKSAENHELHFNYANTLARAKRYTEALTHYTRACTLAPAIPAYRLNLAFLYLKLNDLAQGLPLYESRRELLAESNIAGANIAHVWREDSPVVREEALKNMRVLVFCEQGFGDTLMFARFLPLLKSKVKELLFFPQNALAPLFKEALKTLPQAYDLALPLPSLPLFLKTEAIPAPYIDELLSNSLWEALKARQNKTSSPCPKIGFIYASHSQFPQSAQKSIDPKMLLNALAPLGFELYSLQFEGIAKELCEEFDVQDAPCRDFLSLAQRALEMDFLISVDTAFAHLMGILNLRGAVLLKRDADWRWGDGISSSWYPHLKLLRQQDSWESPLKELANYLKKEYPCG
ncbi:MAG: tetratricopeptide repeat protein [Wolinella sp.]